MVDRAQPERGSGRWRSRGAGLCSPGSGCSAALAARRWRGCGSPRCPQGVYKFGQPYQIAGRWYYPEFDPSYDRIGMASWYGAAFHGRPTANGEVFDRDSLTAAHPTMPLPSLVRVTNLDNGRELELRVNDRGPFVGDRMIDLSQAAARELGFERQGMAPVRVAVPAPRRRPGARRPAARRSRPARPAPRARRSATPVAEQPRPRWPRAPLHRDRAGRDLRGPVHPDRRLRRARRARSRAAARLVAPRAGPRAAPGRRSAAPGSGWGRSPMPARRRRLLGQLKRERLRQRFIVGRQATRPPLLTGERRYGRAVEGCPSDDGERIDGDRLGTWRELLLAAAGRAGGRARHGRRWPSRRRPGRRSCWISRPIRCCSQECRRGDAAGLDEQADDRLHGLRAAEGRARSASTTPSR